jgi:hypothetical protein
MLGMLFGDHMKIVPGEPVATGPDSKSMAAVYVNDEGVPATACVCDLPFAAYSGAALSMIPKGGAEDAAKSGELSEMMQGNLHEIMNICSRLFMNNDTPHVKLETLYDKISAMPENARAMIDAATGRSDFKVSIPGYGDGHVSFLCT